MRTVLPEGAVLVPKHAKRVFKGIIHDIYQWEQEMYDGSTKTFEMLKRPDTVNVLAVKDGKLVIEEQQQPGTGIFYDLPGGRHDVESETELDAIKRELLEETGMKFKSWKLLDSYQPGGHTERFFYLFLAHDFEEQTPANPDSGEKITTKLVTLDEIKELAMGEAGHYLPLGILNRVNSIDDLLNLPEFIGSKP